MDASLAIPAPRAGAKIVILDEHRLSAELLQSYLVRKLQGCVHTPLLFDRAQDALEECCGKGADLLIKDVCLPDMAPMNFLSALRQQAPGTRVLLCSRWAHPALCSSFVKAGVHGIVFKTDSLHDLGCAVVTVLSGGRFFSPAIEEMTFEKVLSGLECLTERELSALRYLAEGQSTKEMAHSMEITPKTAEKYRERLMSKLGLRDVVQLTHFAIRTGLVAV